MSKGSSIRRKRGDTKIGSIEKQYRVDLGVNSNMKLSTYLNRKGYSSLSKALEGRKK